MTTFSVKVAVIPSKFAPLSPGEQTQIQNLISLFTHNAMLPQNLIPNLASIEVGAIQLPADSLKEGDTYDHLALMSLLGEVKDNTTFVVFVKSTTVSVLDSNSLIKMIYDLCDNYMKSAAGDKAHFDLMYLAKWADRCDLFKPIANVFNSTATLVETSAPQGLQAILISPDGATKLKTKLDKPCNYPVSLALTQMVTKGHLKALTTTPNVMEFGAQYATSSADYIKTHECTNPPTDNGKPTPKSSNLSLFVFVIIFLVVVAVFYFLVTMVFVPKQVGMMPVTSYQVVTS
jgi:hypothetical protein